MNLFIERSDGGVTIMRLLDWHDLDREVRCWEEVMGGVKAKAWHLCADATLPATARLQQAWRWNGGTVEVDLPAARQVVMAELRQERDRLLAESDSDKVRLDEVGSPQQQKNLKDWRQALRDLPATEGTRLDAMTAEQLAAYAPAIPANPEPREPRMRIEDLRG